MWLELAESAILCTKITILGQAILKLITKISDIDLSLPPSSRTSSLVPPPAEGPFNEEKTEMKVSFSDENRAV